MATRRVVLSLSVAALALVGIGVWRFMVEPETTSDCAALAEMIAYSRSQSERTADSMNDLVGEPDRFLAEQRQRLERQSEFPTRIVDQGLRSIAESLNRLDVDLIRAWTITAEPQNTNSDSATAEFLRAYSLYTAQRGELIGQAEVVCPGVST